MILDILHMKVLSRASNHGYVFCLHADNSGNMDDVHAMCIKLSKNSMSGFMLFFFTTVTPNLLKLSPDKANSLFRQASATPAIRGSFLNPVSLTIDEQTEGVICNPEEKCFKDFTSGYMI